MVSTGAECRASADLEAAQGRTRLSSREGACGWVKNTTAVVRKEYEGELEEKGSLARHVSRAVWCLISLFRYGEKCGGGG